MREPQTHDHQPCERCGDTSRFIDLHVFSLCSTCGRDGVAVLVEVREPDLNRLRADVRDLGYRVAQ